VATHRLHDVRHARALHDVRRGPRPGPRRSAGLRADDPKAGACGSVYNIVEDGKLNHVVRVERGLMAADCADLLRAFFAQQRAKGKK